MEVFFFLGGVELAVVVVVVVVDLGVLVCEMVVVVYSIRHSTEGWGVDP